MNLKKKKKIWRSDNNVEPFLDFDNSKLNTIKEVRKEDGEDYFRKRKKSSARVRGAKSKAEMMRIFELVEPDIRVERLDKSLTMSQVAGTNVFDVMNRLRAGLLNGHMNLDLMDVNKLRILRHEREDYSDNVIYSMPEEDFWLIIDAIALVCMELRIYKNEHDVDKETLYRDDVMGALNDLLQVRNQEITSIPMFKYSNINSSVEDNYKHGAKRPSISPYMKLKGARYRSTPDREYKSLRMAKYYEKYKYEYSDIYRPKNITLPLNKRGRKVSVKNNPNPTYRTLRRAKEMEASGLRMVKPNIKSDE